MAVEDLCSKAPSVPAKLFSGTLAVAVTSKVGRLDSGVECVDFAAAVGVAVEFDQGG